MTDQNALVDHLPGDVFGQRHEYNWRTEKYRSLLPPQVGVSGLPLYTSIIYGSDSLADAADIFSGKTPGYSYPRLSLGNPTLQILGERLLDLEFGADPLRFEYDCLLTSSGMAAIAMTLLSLVERNSRIISSPYLYGGTYNLLTEYLPQLGHCVCLVDEPNHLSSWRTAFSMNTHSLEGGVMFAEDEANPMIIKLDNAKLAGLAHRRKMLYVVDRTVGTPLSEQPFLHTDPDARPDIVIHSLSKAINGRSDCLGGAIIGKKELIDKIRGSYFLVFGPVMDPRVADVILENMKDFEWRMRTKIANARAVASFLRSREVEIAQVNGPGGDLMSFEMRGGYEVARSFVEALKIPVLAPHLGDIQSLVIHPASTTHSRVPSEARLKLGITDGLVRMAIGMEDPCLLILDIERALNQLGYGLPSSGGALMT